MTDEILEAPIEITPPAPPLPGKILAQARKEKGLSVADVARSLRLSVRQIEAIDADDFDKLPGKTFLRGFIRNYAKLLQIDPEPLLQGRLAAAPQQRFQAQAISVPPGRVEYSPPRGQRTFSTDPDRPWLKYLLTILIVLVLAGGGAYEWLRGGDMRTVVVKPVGEPVAEPAADKPAAEKAENPAVPLALPPAEPVQPLANPQPPALPPPAAAPAPKAGTPPAPVQSQLPPPVGVEAAALAGAKVKFSFLGESWVDIRDKNGRSIYKQLGRAGEEQTISGTPPLSLTIGKAANVKVLYNDKPVDLEPHMNGDVARLNLK
ncbi:MAG: RodZ domain-containing protein [Sulfuricellaceae bacterium]